MSDKPQRRRKWRWVALGILVGVPAVLILILTVMIQTHRLRPDQRRVPTRFLTIKPTEATSGTTVVRFDPSKQLHYEDYFEQVEGKDTAALYRKLTDMSWTKNCPLIERQPGEPLTAEQARWLTENRRLVEDMLRLARLTTEPALPWDAVLQNSRNIPVPNWMMYQRCSLILTAEARQRRDTGDWAGAADVLGSINPMAQAIQPPWLIGHLVGVAMQTKANKELACWISSGGVPADIARSLQDRMSRQVIGLADYRKALEGEYASGRNSMVEMLNSSIPDMIRQTVGGSKSASLGEIFWNHPGKFMATGIMGMLAKANASTIVDRFDALNNERFAALDKGERFDWNSDSLKILNVPYSPKFPIANFDEAHTRTDTNMTLLKLDIAGLNLSQGKPAGETDPFTNESLKTAQDGGETVIYSVGPDKKDDGGAITYDPTNGTFSRGDISLRVGRK